MPQKKPPLRSSSDLQVRLAREPGHSTRSLVFLVYLQIIDKTVCFLAQEEEEGVEPREAEGGPPLGVVGASGAAGVAALEVGVAGLGVVVVVHRGVGAVVHAVAEGEGEEA